MRNSLQKTTNLSKNLGKYLQRNIFLVKPSTCSFCRKNELHCKFLSNALCSFQEHLFQNRPPSKNVTILKFNLCYIYIVIVTRYCSSFSAVTVCSLDRLNNDKSLIKTKLNRLNNSVSSAINNKERETWKLQRESTQWKVEYMVNESTLWRVQYKVHESNMKNMV